MKNPIRILAALAVVATLAVAYGCKDDDPTPLTLSTITVGGADLNGATSPTGVATNAAIEVNLSTTVDASTATAANIKLTRQYDSFDVPLTIVPSGSKITITPTTALAGGNLYVLTVSEAVKSDAGQTLASISRNFKTAGFFEPSGQAAYWMFEDNGTDAVGNHSTTSSTAVTFVAGRNTAAGKAASFNGTTSVMEAPDGDDFLDANSFSLSFWVKPDASNTHGHFVLGVAGYLGFQFEIPQNITSAKIATQYSKTNGESQAEDTWWPGEGLTADSWVGWTFSKDVGGGDGVKAIFADKWAHVITTFNASTRVGTMYVNGEKVKAFDFNKYPSDDLRKGTSGVKFAGKAAPGNNLAFGFLQSTSETNRSLGDDWAAYENENNNHFKGLLDDVRIFKRALTDAEVTLIYDSEK